MRLHWLCWLPLTQHTEYPDCSVSHQRSAEFHHLLVCQNPNKHRINNLGKILYILNCNIYRAFLLLFSGSCISEKNAFNNWVLINDYTKIVYKTLILINIENRLQTLNNFELSVADLGGGGLGLGVQPPRKFYDIYKKPRQCSIRRHW